jgi:acetate---CoA ligase (ADP-forming)
MGSAVRRLVDARSVAVIGASPGNVYTNNVIPALRRSSGVTVFPVNPSRDEFMGLKCFPSIGDIEDPVDLAFVAVRAESVLPALQEAYERQVGAAVIVSAGFAESPGEAGKSRQRELSEFAKRTGMQICGPTCLGLSNVQDNRHYLASGAAGEIPRGNIGLVSQSGGTLSGIIRSAAQRRAGFSYVISSGTEACLSTCDYTEMLVEDEHTEILCLFLEKLTEPERFLMLSRQAADRGKALFCIKIGSTDSGRRAALSHTGAITGSDDYFNTLFREAGVQRCASIEEMMDRASLLAQSRRENWPRGRRVGILTVSGGAGTILTDLLSQSGLDVPALGQEQAARLSEAVPERILVGNPVDINAQLQRQQPGLWAMAVETLAASGSFDSVVVADLHPQDASRVRALEDIRKRTGTPIVLTAVAEGMDILQGEAAEFQRSVRLPFARGVESLARGLGGAVRAGEYRHEVAAKDAAWWDLCAYGTDAVMGADRELGQNEVSWRRFLASSGLHGPREIATPDIGELGDLVAGLSFPVALKVLLPGVQHKAQLGLVALGLRSADETVGAAHRLRRRASTVGSEPTYLVQEMVSDAGLELYVSSLSEAGERPLITVAQGGAEVEQRAIFARRLAPVSDENAMRMLGEITTAATLAKVDSAAAAAAISGLSQAALGLRPAGVRLIELNPIMIRPPGLGAVVVDTVLQ